MRMSSVALAIASTLFACGDDASTDDTPMDAGSSVVDAGSPPTDAGEPADSGAMPSAERAYCESIAPTAMTLGMLDGDCDQISVPATDEAGLAACAMAVMTCDQSTLDWFRTYNESLAMCLSGAPACTSANAQSWANQYLNSCAQQAVLAAGAPPWGMDSDCGLAP